MMFKEVSEPQRGTSYLQILFDEQVFKFPFDFNTQKYCFKNN